MTGIALSNSFNPAKVSSEEPLPGSSFPLEIYGELFERLQVSELLMMRRLRHHNMKMIDNNPLLQRRISHEFLLKMHSKCNIPLHDLKYCLMDNKLGVEINSNLTLWKVNNWLLRTIPWINHLIIRDAIAPPLNELFIHLKKNSGLISLCLIDCEVDLESQNHVLSLLNAKKPPVFYYGNLKPVNCAWIAPSNGAILIDSKKAESYSLERFFGEESDVIALKKFEEAVSNESASNQEVLEMMGSLRPLIQSEIIYSFWYSCVMHTCSIYDSPYMIQWKTHAFVEQNAHHPALISAARKQLEGSKALYSSNDISS